VSKRCDCGDDGPNSDGGCQSVAGGDVIDGQCGRNGEVLHGSDHEESNLSNAWNEMSSRSRSRDILLKNASVGVVDKSLILHCGIWPGDVSGYEML
jgi:hypothetical protein